MSENVDCGHGENQWSEELDEQERGKREQLISRINELLHTDILKEMDCLLIYEVLLQAVRREQAETFEQYMIDCVNGDC